MQFVSFGWITSSLSLYLVHCMDIVCFPRNLDLLSFQATPRSFRSKCFKSLDLRKPLRSIGPTHEIKGFKNNITLYYLQRISAFRGESFWSRIGVLYHT